MFELVIAARLTRAAGLKTYLHEPDVIADVNDWRLFVACKRPFGDASIKGNVVKAGLQSHRALQNDENPKHIGMIALSVSKILNPGDKILEIPRRSDLSEGLGQHVEAIWQ
jgi:hypothetical protein